MKLICHGSTSTARSGLQHYHKNIEHQQKKEETERPRKVTGFVASKCSYDQKRQEQVTALVTSAISDDILTLNVVEGVGFQRLIESVKPKYAVY